MRTPEEILLSAMGDGDNCLTAIINAQQEAYAEGIRKGREEMRENLMEKFGNLRRENTRLAAAMSQAKASLEQYDNDLPAYKILRAALLTVAGGDD